MSLTQTNSGAPYPRPQAQLMMELLSRPSSALRIALLGGRREGKSDLLHQVYELLFRKAEGPLPFQFSFEPVRHAESNVASARRFVAGLCRQVRAFVMRQEEQLHEPLGRVDSELERAGLPLALSELGREFLSLPAEEQAEFAAALPAQFAQRDGRPLCLLFDDLHFEQAEIYLNYLNHPRLSWMVTARAPSLRRIAGERSWQVVNLEPLTLEEFLFLAEERCREFELPFVRDVWEIWVELAGTSPALLETLVEAALTSRTRVDSVEMLGWNYVREATAGSLAISRAESWRRAVASSDQNKSLRVAQSLLQLDAGGSGNEISAAEWDGLVSEEWAEESGLGYRPRLGMIERDWLQFGLANGSGMSAQARALQGFFLRAEHARQWRSFSQEVAEVRSNLLRLPDLQTEGITGRSAKDALPLVCSVARERSYSAELYWCYGFRPDWPQERRDRPEAASVYLIALCREQPSPAEVKQWNKRLQEQVRSLPLAGVPETGSAGLGPRYELWLALPRSATLTPVAGEKRLRWETLAGLLAATPPRLVQAPSTERAEEQLRLSELEARAQWLEEELATARDQFEREARRRAPKEPGGSAPPPEPAPEAEPRVTDSRQDLALTLLQLSSELLALQSASDPASLAAIEEIRLRTQRLAEMLRQPGRAARTESHMPRSKGPSTPPER